ncbi:hypothetical protein G7L40_00420 [Paenibacillus polymyxa]|uniref:Uncharacterized protein n=1 Tax=Paenibacillus polymyxa TaxID=1406 RepID=A0A378XW40_PAEPO|nr:hypothetical protein [Paenibacillus polymyxa]MBE7897174.1 hypothetical protein [Paenibacillus polymyxa]MBG9763031.1 hypothetical protein [Paenibacillus polymyxa]MCC3257577.1 hypothetical protein [Paenibacillus polymyxa]QPK51340.1 hypothetical protein G7035_00420 [Paenibacillus polymyxa]QPK56430.1 hypothetical protein G7L40_00420 [Paenibacillus polymyxa]
MYKFYIPKDYSIEDTLYGEDHDLKDHTNKSLLITLSIQLDTLSMLPQGEGKSYFISTCVNPILEEIDKRLSKLK